MFLLGNFVLHCGAPLVRDVHVLSVFLRFRLDRRLDEIPAMISLHVTDLRPQSFVLSLIDLVDTYTTRTVSIIIRAFRQSPAQIFHIPEKSILRSFRRLFHDTMVIYIIFCNVTFRYPFRELFYFR